MSGPYCTAADVKQAVADVLKVGDPDTLEPYWDRIVPDALAAAYQDILAALIGRGYTAAQIDGWATRATYNRDVALFWALTKAGGLGSYSDQQITKLDRRKELKDLTLTDAAGGVIVPGGGSGADGTDTNADGIPDTFGGAAIGGGRLDQTNWRWGSNRSF